MKWTWTFKFVLCTCIFKSVKFTCTFCLNIQFFILFLFACMIHCKMSCFIAWQFQCRFYLFVFFRSAFYTLKSIAWTNLHSTDFEMLLQHFSRCGNVIGTEMCNFYFLSILMYASSLWQACTIFGCQVTMATKFLAFYITLSA